jgi:signal transduction histidine kinase
MTRLTIRAALYLGFGLTFGVWLLTGYQFSRRMSELEQRTDENNARYMRGQDLLSIVRAQILLGSIYARDALLDPDAASVDDYRRQLQEAYRSADEALQQFAPVLDSPAKHEQLTRLREGIDGFRNTLLQVLSIERPGRLSEALALLRTQVIPKRDDAIRLAEDIQALNRSEFVQLQAETAQTHRLTQRQIWLRLGFALALSLAIAGIAAIYAGRLEYRLRRQSKRNEQNAHELQRLSAQLIRAQEEERRTIARELHDEVGQVLTALKVELALAQRSTEAANGPAHMLDTVRSMTDGAIHTVRDLSRLLHPSVLDDLGLPAAVDAYLQGFSRRHGVKTQLLQNRMEERLPSEIEASIYRICQEGLTNVAKHARANRVGVFLQRLPETVLMTIEDDGIGFELSERAADLAGLGLIGIRERVANLRGTLRIESAPGKGTRVTVECPVRFTANDTDQRTRSAFANSAPDVEVVRG